MRFLVDENLSWRHAARLRTLGHDAVAVSEVSLSGACDPVVRVYAAEKDRILITLDADFGNTLRFPVDDTPGVIWLRLHPPTEEAISAALDRVIHSLNTEELAGRLVVVDEHKMRVRGVLRS